MQARREFIVYRCVCAALSYSCRAVYVQSIGLSGPWHIPVLHWYGLCGPYHVLAVHWFVWLLMRAVHELGSAALGVRYSFLGATQNLVSSG